MKLRKLSKEKRNQLILVLVGTVAVLGGLGFGLVKVQYEKLRSLEDQTAAAEVQLKKMEDAVKRAELVEKVYNLAAANLTEKESTMAAGDLYSWMYTNLRGFQKSYKVEIPQLSPISGTANVNLIPDFPYKQATMQVGGTACYHDLGQFIADFENTFPLIRVANLTIDLNRSPGAGSQEKLNFKMDLITLVNSAKR
jgi:hypothetical protein